MANEPAEAVPNPNLTAAGTAAPADETRREAGIEGEGASTAAEPHVSNPNPSTTTTGDSAASEEAASLLAGVDSVADIQRLMQGVPPVSEMTPATPAVDPEDPQSFQEGQPLPTRIRIKNLPPERQELIAKLARNPDAPLADLLGTVAPVATVAPGEQTPAPSVTAPASQVTLAPAPEQTVESVQELIKQKRTERANAKKLFDADAETRLDAEIDDLQDSLPALMQQWSEHSRQWDRAVRDSQKRAVIAYPDASNKESALGKEMIRLDASFTAGGKSFAQDADYPYFLTVLAAQNLGLAPKAKAAPAPATAVPAAAPLKPAPVSAPTARAATPAAQPPAPAAGAARTQAPSPDAEHAQARQALDSIQDTGSLTALLSRLK